MTEEQEKNKTPECGYYLNQIYFYLTQGCNLKCRHCWIAPKYQTEETIWPALDFEVFKDIIRQGMDLGLSGVKLTGGEPLIHPDTERILDHIRETGLRLTIETNGVKCTSRIAEKIVKNKNPFVSVSLDGPDAETHEWVRGVPGCFEGALEGVRNLVQAGLRPQIIMSVMRRNADMMESLVRLAEKENAESVKFNLVTPTARGEQMQKSGETLSIKELIDLGHWVENTLEPSSELRIVYSHPTAFRPLSKIFTKSDGRCGIFGIIGVLGNGKYALCGIGETVPELIFGDAETDRLADVWNQNPVLNDIRKGLPQDLKGICNDCLMKNMCLGSCVAMNYYRSKNLFSPYWYCELAHEAKLFPGQRIRPGSISEYGEEPTSKI